MEPITNLESTLFPIAAEKHVVFAIVSSLFFLLQFIRTRKLYQLIMAIAIPASLLIYLAPENTALFYGIGIAEGLLLLLAFITGTVRSVRDSKAAKAAEAAAKAAQTKETEA
ncbi:MAG TPA: hypothetical protein DDX71_04385 [Ruminococcus sp.]|nr:hypothetical protein [Ruminococcus sp.]